VANQSAEEQLAANYIKEARGTVRCVFDVTSPFWSKRRSRRSSGRHPCRFEEAAVATTWCAEEQQAARRPAV
jgi:hypothetical protein